MSAPDLANDASSPADALGSIATQMHSPPPAPELSDWGPLLSFVPPIDLQNEILGRDEAWAFQSVHLGKGDAFLDFYAVQIDELPLQPSTAERYTPTTFLQRVRRDLSNFTTPVATFTPFEDRDAAAWLSDTPQGTVIVIDIQQPELLGVVCTRASPLGFTFTTLKMSRAPFGGQPGSHPVSGHREWGLIERDGRLIFFTRGADRTTGYLDVPVMATLGKTGQQSVWTMLTKRVAAFVSQNGGRAQVLPPVIVDVEWDDARQHYQPIGTWTKLFD